MRWPGLLLAAAVALTLLAAANRVVRRMSVNSVPRQVIRKIESAPPTIDVLAIGNSLMQSGFDPAAIEEVYRRSGQRVVAINGGLGASGVIEHLLLARMAFRNHTVRTLVYGFFDDQLQTGQPRENSALLGNRAMLYYVEPQLVLKYVRFNSIELFEYHTYRFNDLLIERSAIWARVERLRRKMGEIGMSTQATNQFGRVADFELLEASSEGEFVRQCRKALQAEAPFSGPVQALLDQAREHGTKVILVEMPMHPNHVSRFYSQPVWRELRARIREAGQNLGATYLDASQWMPRSDQFADHLHLSDAGATEFSAKLAFWMLKSVRQQ